MNFILEKLKVSELKKYIIFLIYKKIIEFKKKFLNLLISNKIKNFYFFSFFFIKQFSYCLIIILDILT